MAIRIRKVRGKTVALCAVETDPKSGDIYLDDAIHEALATKFSYDWKLGWEQDELVARMQEEKIRDAQEELIKWQMGKKL